MQRILITGANGLLGSHLLPLLKDKYDLHLLQRHAMAANEVHVSFQQVDLGASHLPELPAKMDAIIYLAQSERYREFPEGATDVFQVNTAQVINLLDYARRAGVKKFIYASTGGVYTGGKNLSETEVLPTDGSTGFYAATKLATELLVQSYKGFFDVVNLRFFFIYGKGQKPYMLMPRLVDSVRTEKPVKLAGNKGLHLNPVHARDAAIAVAAALQSQGTHVINVAGPEIISLREVVEIIGRKLSKTPVIECDHNAAEPWLTADISLMKKILATPKITFEEGVTDLI